MSERAEKIGVVIPTVEGRESLLGKAVRTTCPPWAESRDNITFGVSIEHDHDSCGAAWNAGVNFLLNAGADYILLTADDLAPMSDTWHWWALAACDREELPGAFVYDEHTLQRHEDGGPAGATVPFSRVPFMPAWVAAEIFPMPELHFYSDTWIGHIANQRLCWPTRLTYGFEFVHSWAQPGRKDGERAKHDLELYEHELQAIPRSSA